METVKKHLMNLLRDRRISTALARRSCTPPLNPFLPGQRVEIWVENISKKSSFWEGPYLCISQVGGRVFILKGKNVIIRNIQHVRLDRSQSDPNSEAAQKQHFNTFFEGADKNWFGDVYFNCGAECENMWFDVQYFVRSALDEAEKTGTSFSQAIAEIRDELTGADEKHYFVDIDGEADKYGTTATYHAQVFGGPQLRRFPDSAD